jgi:hypothetical protein
VSNDSKNIEDWRMLDNIIVSQSESKSKSGSASSPQVDSTSGSAELLAQALRLGASAQPKSPLSVEASKDVASVLGCSGGTD